MRLPPNELYSAFSFIGFIFCVIPFYWHFKGNCATIRLIEVLFLRINGIARNAGTCSYLIWTGLGCLLQCINSIVWNKNMINRVPVYCDICMSFYATVLTHVHSLYVTPTATRIQVALNAAIPASSLCINRQLYRVAMIKTARITDVEKRRNLIYDLLISVGIPVLQMAAGECA